MVHAWHAVTCVISDLRLRSVTSNVYSKWLCIILQYLQNPNPRSPLQIPNPIKRQYHTSSSGTATPPEHSRHPHDTSANTRRWPDPPALPVS